MNRILISDPTLRDGNHAVKHQLSSAQMAIYAKAADKAGIPIVEVGHGNGLAGSSLQVGKALLNDREMLETVRKNLKHSKMGIHVIPGFATLQNDIQMAMDLGVDVFRVASHCTEADTTQRHISHLRENGKEVFGVLMMSHMASKQVLAEEAQKMESYGAEAVILMDSAGNYLPNDVTDKVGELIRQISVPVGFHAHNNLGMAIANSVAAAQAGATILDGCARGFGAGAGNAQLEVLVAVLDRMGYQTGIDLYKMLDAADIAEQHLITNIPYPSSLSIVSGTAGVFSAFAPHVMRIAKEYQVDHRDIFFELGRRKVVAGQEDMILEVASQLAREEKAI